jgi:acyl dehydratase
MAGIDERERVGARITPEQVAKIRARVGYSVDHNYRFNDEATHDTIRHFAHGYGDDNPLWCDPAYGPGTRWGATIAPPLMHMSMGIDQSPPLPPEVKAASRGALAGVHLFHAGTEIEWARPVCVGDRLYYTGVLAAVDEKVSEFAAQTLITHHELRWANQRGEDTVWQHEWFVRAERKTAAERGTLSSYEEARYTDEDLARIDAAYAAERPRGTEPRWFEDVRVGDRIPGVVKGPLCVTDIISFHTGWGWAGYDFGPFRLGWKHRQKMPRFWTKDRRGAWDVAQRLHWEEDWAAEVGVPLRYDYGYMRTAWMIHALTDWMGDDAFLARFWNRFHRFNFVGDTSWVEGHVTDVSSEDGRHRAELELRIVDQRGEVTTSGGATVLLPSRGGGPVLLPELTGERRH